MPKRILFYLFLTIPFLLMCKEEPPEITEPQNYSLTFDINHLFNGEPMVFNETSYQNAAGNTIGFYNFKYLISDITLIQEDGAKLVLEEETGFIDAVNERNSFTIEDIPEGNYKSIEFMIGLNEEINTADPAQYPVTHPLSPLLNGLHWSWTEGYIFLAMEGTYEKEDGIGAFTYHIAFEENQMHFEFPQSFNLNKNLGANFTFDLAEIYTNPTEFDIEEQGNFTHSSDDNGMANTLRDNVLGALNLESYE